jgi:hypothetical protein
MIISVIVSCIINAFIILDLLEYKYFYIGMALIALSALIYVLRVVISTQFFSLPFSTGETESEIEAKPHKYEKLSFISTILLVLWIATLICINLKKRGLINF